MRRKPGDMLSYLEYIIQVIHSLLMNRHLHIVSYVLLLSLLNSSCTSSFPAFSRAAWARRSAPRVPTTTGSCASERRSSLRRSIDSRGGEKLLCRYSSSYPNLQKIRNICGEIISGFTQKVRSSAENALSAMKRCGLEASDFYRSFPKVLSLYAGTGKNDVITAPATFLARGSDSDLWFTKSARKANLEKARGLGTCFEDFCSLFGEEFRIYNTALLISDQLYELGVSADIDREFEAVLKERNVLSIDDSNLILRNIIDGSDAPFVYEKTGVRYENFLLDEFQDTSRMQWENFHLLLEESDFLPTVKASSYLPSRMRRSVRSS